MRALVRGLARSFQDSIKMAPAAEQQAISMAAAEEQRQAYVQLLRTLLQDVVEVPADDAHPGECCACLCCLIVLDGSRLMGLGYSS